MHPHLCDHSSSLKPNTPISLLQDLCRLLRSLTLFFSTFLRSQIADGNAEASYWGIWMGEHRERISSSIQEMMAGPNTILNRTGGDAGYKSILSPNDDHHLEHIFRAHCCLDVWLSWGRLIHKTTHWSYVEVTFKRGGGGDAESKFWGESEREWERMTETRSVKRNPAVTQTQEYLHINAHACKHKQDHAITCSSLHP